MHGIHYDLAIRPAADYLNGMVVMAMASEISENALKAAYNRANDSSLTQQQIADSAGLGSQAQVSRLLAEAREHKVLREVFQWPADVSDEVRLKVLNSYFKRHGELADALADKARQLRSTHGDGGSPFNRLHVVAAPDVENWADESARERALQSFGISAAEIVADYIEEAETCCVAWGRTIAATVGHIRPRNGEYPKKKFIPIAGEPTNHEPNGVSASDAARTLSKAWPKSESLSLRGVQARIPKSFCEGDKLEIAKELIGYSEDYRRIFGKPGVHEASLISEVPMILTGIGDVDTSKQPVEGVGPDPWYLETEDAEGKEALALTAGNIGGVWIAGNDVPDPDAAKEKVEDANRRWLGAQESHFSRCSLNADAQRHRPGVVVLAVEPGKKAIILQALHLVNVLIVSRQLAEALALELLGPTLAATP
jgi:DNA-binding transcriptional regulator LsrR (DeoR family)